MWFQLFSNAQIQNPSKAGSLHAQRKKNEQQAQAAAAQQVAMGYSNSTLIRQRQLHLLQAATTSGGAQR
ncbi:hypothetical protein PsorP6_000289 [Peronosclerospora sorghi]|uniref:Uncharacterized protein n=1 Tax=Peronosclerospora sorghi TaxID=230839 RepID=A0ACC0WU01_9STRA|nr:hypothetical protein PsorP6_000289 [Peronosclerospora sorghi]